MNEDFKDVLKLYKPKYISWYNRLKLFLIPYLKVEKLVPKKGFIIDLGCSHGLFTNLLAFKSKERKVLGLEINNNRIKYANIGISNASFEAGDITKMNIPETDCIIFTHVLHHLKNYEEQEKLLQACYNKLRVGGYIIISEVDKFPKWKYIISLFADYILYPFERINYRSVENFTSLLKKINFSVEVVPLHKGSVFSHITFVGKKV